MSKKNKYYNKEKEIKMDSEVIETVYETVEKLPEAIEEIIEDEGYVTDCYELRLREEPSDKANVLTLLTVGTNVIIKNNLKKINGFYEVDTPIGISGFVMAKFIAVK